MVKLHFIHKSWGASVGYQTMVGVVWLSNCYQHPPVRPVERWKQLFSSTLDHTSVDAYLYRSRSQVSMQENLHYMNILQPYYNHITTVLPNNLLSKEFVISVPITPTIWWRVPTSISRHTHLSASTLVHRLNSPPSTQPADFPTPRGLSTNPLCSDVGAVK